MVESVLKTKLYIPPTPHEMVSRQRLLERLSLALCHKLTLISAPAGYGKTTLLSELIHTKHLPCAWISLDEEDNDPISFWSHFVSALQTVESEIGKAAMGALTSPQPYNARTMLRIIINDISDRPKPSSPHILVLDHYNVIDNQSIHEDLTFLIDHLPEQLRLVIATRIDPPLPLARLRANDHLSEIRAEELRFNREEMSTLLNNVVGLDISDDDVSALESRTEGWIASIQMAAISMRGRADKSDFIKAFSGSNRYVLDYLTEEVLNRQPPNVCSFLLQTSVLDRLSASLCNAVTRRGDSQEILKQLETANLFITPLDENGEWYRYHRLFNDLLRQQLRQIEPEVIPALHSRASEWYEKNGLIEQAIGHALNANDEARAANLIEQGANRLFIHGEFVAFRRWTQTLSDNVMRTRPILCIYHALSLVYTSDKPQSLESILQQLEENDRTEANSGAILLLKALISMFQGNTQLSLELSNRALGFLPKDNLFLKQYVVAIRGRILIMNGNISEAIHTFEDLTELSKKTGNRLIYLIALFRLAELHVAQGQLQEAKTHYNQILEMTVDLEWKNQPTVGLALIGLGGLEYEWNHLEAASNYLKEGIELIGRYAKVWALDGYIVLSRVRQAQGYPEEAAEIIQRAIHIAEDFDLSQLEDIYIGEHQARIWIRQRNLEAASRWIEESKLYTDHGIAEIKNEDSRISFYALEELKQITRARLFIAQGKVAEALELLAALLETAEGQNRRGSLIEISILEAITYQLSNHMARAISSFERALSLARSAGYVRTFVDEGEPVKNLLLVARNRRVETDYVSKLLLAFPTVEPNKPSPVRERGSAHTLVESLSERELEILQLIEAGCSNRDIAEKLFLAVGTVKKHIFNIYSKLAVKNRTQAVASAKSKGLL